MISAIQENLSFYKAKQEWMCPWLCVFSVIPFWGIFMSPDQSSRLWQPDGCWWGWIPAGARSGSGARCGSFMRQDDSIPLALRGLVFRQDVEGLTPTISLSRVVWLWYLCSSLQQADGQDVLERLIWRTQVRALCLSLLPFSFGELFVWEEIKPQGLLPGNIG